ncbi:MAG: hypothetical protein K2N51_09660 [Lachnospiraceae bacterium]|nr:hypothetical protein [Lachnospiraceae bacterium]
MKIYNNDIMEAVRQRMGLEKDDTSKDDEIMKMDKEEVFREYCQWHGLSGAWYLDILEVIGNIYNVSLE